MSSHHRGRGRTGRNSRRYYDPGKSPRPPRPDKRPGDATTLPAGVVRELHLRELDEAERLERLRAAQPMTRQQRRKLERDSKARHPHGIGEVLP